MAECENCGAPDNGQDVICKFCKSPVSKDLLSSAIACPVCRAANRPGRTQCSSCNGSLLLQCVFCGHASPASMSDCQKCGESFLGAQERKSQREADKLLGAVGSFVSNLVGGSSASSSASDSSSSSSDSSSDDYRSRRGNSGNDPPPMDS
jgi:hypothetical protein